MSPMNCPSVQRPSVLSTEQVNNVSDLGWLKKTGQVIKRQKINLAGQKVTYQWTSGIPPLLGRRKRQHCVGSNQGQDVPEEQKAEKQGYEGMQQHGITMGTAALR